MNIFLNKGDIMLPATMMSVTITSNIDNISKEVILEKFDFEPWLIFKVRWRLYLRKELKRLSKIYNKRYIKEYYKK